MAELGPSNALQTCGDTGDSELSAFHMQSPVHKGVQVQRGEAWHSMTFTGEAVRYSSVDICNVNTFVSVSTSALLR